MKEIEYEEFRSIKAVELRELQKLTIDIFSKIGTEKSRQRLVYDLLNALKTNDRKRFLWLILKNANTLKSEDKKVASFTRTLSNFYIEHETPENFEKIAYSIVMGIMAVEEKGGDESE